HGQHGYDGAGNDAEFHGAGRRDHAGRTDEPDSSLFDHSRNDKYAGNNHLAWNDISDDTLLHGSRIDYAGCYDLAYNAAIARSGKLSVEKMQRRAPAGALLCVCATVRREGVEAGDRV
ncbi:MAG TPA: hypothetical protein VM865_04880, partial [Acidobacteriaceae bacterium]|nr:hypothetical protein [Acidobacteriaceae bacterium]